eukprot:1192475-Prorocentrum_minimum.AAC.2
MPKQRSLTNRWDTHKKKREEELTKAQQAEQLAISCVGFIFVMYRSNTWWYELVDLVRKLILTGIISTVEKGTSTQVSDS